MACALGGLGGRDALDLIENIASSRLIATQLRKIHRMRSIEVCRLGRIPLVPKHQRAHRHCCHHVSGGAEEGIVAFVVLTTRLQAISTSVNGLPTGREGVEGVVCEGDVQPTLPLQHGPEGGRLNLGGERAIRDDVKPGTGTRLTDSHIVGELSVLVLWMGAIRVSLRRRLAAIQPLLQANDLGELPLCGGV